MESGGELMMWLAVVEATLHEGLTWREGMRVTKKYERGGAGKKRKEKK